MGACAVGELMACCLAMRTMSNLSESQSQRQLILNPKAKLMPPDFTSSRNLKIAVTKQSRTQEQRYYALIC